MAAYNLGYVTEPTLDAAITTPGAAAPANALQIGGSDGANLRVLSTDTSGRVYTLKAAGTTATTIVNDKAKATVAATAILGAPYAVPSNGTVNVHVAIGMGDTSTAFSYTVDGGANYVTVNGGQNLVAGAGYVVSIPVANADSLNFQTTAATTLAILEAFFTPGQG